MKPHRHSALIKQWADGHKVEILSRVDGGWHEEEYPDWDEDYTYRIKDLEERLDSTKVVVERQWVGLTSAELASIVVEHAGYPTRLPKAIEAKLKEKNT